MLRATIAVILGSVVTSGLFARDIYVDNVRGDDARDGSSPAVQGRLAGPCRTIGRALQRANNGDRIVLANNRGEAYRESVTLQAGRHSGLPNRPFTLDGNGAVLDGSQPVPPRAWQHVQGHVFRYRPPGMSYQVLYLDDKPAKRAAVSLGEGLPDLAPLQWCLYQRHIYFRAEKNRLPRHYDLAYTGLPVGITLYEVRHVVVRDLIIQGFQLDGINAHDSVFDAELVGLTCRGNGRSGISIGGASRVDITACLVGDNGAAQVRTEGFSHTRIRNCDLIETSAPALLREGGEVSLLGTDEAGAEE
ncbi:MAG: right-handed parallel beta-helix repeat-containing protein [Pirellulaceae bacterium]